MGYNSKFIWNFRTLTDILSNYSATYPLARTLSDIPVNIRNPDSIQFFLLIQKVTEKIAVYAISSQ